MNSPIKVGTKAAAVVALLLLLPNVSHADSPGYGPWIPINDGNRNLIQIAFKRIPTNCNGNSCLYYWKFRNDYPGNATIDCNILTVDDHGKQRQEMCAAGTLKPGENKDPGWWTYSVSEPTVVLRAAKANAAVRELSFPSRKPAKGYLSILRDYRRGAKSSLPDGAHEKLIAITDARRDPTRCRGVTIASTRNFDYALFNIVVDIKYETRGGMITQTSETYGSEAWIGRCVSDTDAKGYPRVLVRPFMRKTPGVAGPRN